ncbi:MAG: peptidoglycan-binding protein [Chthoniobacterales bacterium]
MRKFGMIFGALWVAAAVQAQSDPGIASAQRALKDQGFYYGEITGQKDADTTAAIRRYQIRNGLQITGDLTPETQKSLGLKKTAPPSRATPSVPPRQPAPPDTSDLRDDSPIAPVPPSTSGETSPPPPPQDAYVPGPRGFTPETTRVFDGTPYQVAPPNVQRRVIGEAQALLARRGYYRSGIDGVYGPGTEFALRAFQARFGIEPNGRLDMATLGALGLLPGQEAPGLTAPRRRALRPSAIFPPGSEPLFIPR